MSAGGAPLSAQKSQTTGVLALLLCAALWSLNGPLIKILHQELPGITIACYRSLIAGGLFLPFALGRARSIRNARPAWAIASVTTFTVMTACFVIATTKTAAASAIILQYLSPIVVFILSPIVLKEKPRWAEGLVLVGAMAGVGIMLAVSDRAEVGTLLIAIVSGLGYGTLIVTLRGLKAVDPFVVTTLNFFGSGVILLPMIPMLGGVFLISGQKLAIVTLMSIVQFALPYVIFSWAIRRVEAHKASLIVLLEPVLNPLFTWIAVREPIPTATLMGGPLILASVVAWVVLHKSRRANSE